MVETIPKVASSYQQVDPESTHHVLGQQLLLPPQMDEELEQTLKNLKVNFTNELMHKINQ